VLHGKAAERLSSYYQLGCDHGTTIMMSWENGGVAPIYLCESHATQLGKNCEAVLTITPQAVSPNPIEPPKTVPSRSSLDAQVGLGKEYLARAPVPDLTSGDSVKASLDRAIGDMVREDFEAYGTVLQRAPSTATEDTQAESADLERLCVSGHGARCTYEATVRCPNCRRWFCDAHAEDEKWHFCALTA
jgi:hypothetical protein